jgi:hypothetical protein
MPVPLRASGCALPRSAFLRLISPIEPSITAGKLSKIVILEEPGTHYHAINAV